MDPVLIGRRIRRLRDLRGLTQEGLAQLAGRTGRWLFNVETGRTSPSLDDIIRLAQALRIDVTVVLCLAPIPVALLRGTKARDRDGVDDDVNRRTFLKTAGVAGVALAVTPQTAAAGLSRIGIGEIERLHLAVVRATRLERASQYTALRAVLPRVLADAERMAREAPDDAGQAVYSLHSQALAVSAWLLIKEGGTFDAQVAAGKALDVARRAGNTVLVGAALRCLGETHMRAGDYALASDLSIEAAEFIARSDMNDSDDALCVRGAGYLSGAMACARAGDRYGANELLEAAHECAGRLGRDVAGAAVFGPANVAIHRVAIPMDLGDSTAALQWSERTEIRFPPGFEERRGRYLIDVARAFADRGRDAEAAHTLLQAEMAAPEEVRSHRLTRDVLGVLLGRSRRGTTPDLRSIASRCGAIE